MNNSGFTEKEKAAFLLKRHIRNHMFEFVLEIIVNVALADLIVYISNGNEYVFVSALAFIYSIIKILYNLWVFKKEYISINLKNEQL